MGDTPPEAVTLNETDKLPDQIPTGEEEPQEEKPFLLPIYVYTAIFGAIFVLGPLFVRRGPNKSITRCCIMLSAFCCWIFWTTTYIVQMHPLLGPRLSNETVAWIGYKWGKDPRFCITNEDKEAEAEAKADAKTAGSVESGKKTDTATVDPENTPDPNEQKTEDPTPPTEEPTPPTEEPTPPTVEP